MNKSFDSRVSPAVEQQHPGTGEGWLELPDGSDFDPAPRRMEAAAALRLCEEMFTLFHRNAPARESRQDRPGTEFDLANPASGPDNYPADLLDELLQRH